MVVWSLLTTKFLSLFEFSARTTTRINVRSSSDGFDCHTHCGHSTTTSPTDTPPLSPVDTTTPRTIKLERCEIEGHIDLVHQGRYRFTVHDHDMTTTRHEPFINIGPPSPTPPLTCKFYMDAPPPWPSSPSSTTFISSPLVS